MNCPRLMPGEKHWHGAGPDGPMTHLAVQEALDGKTADWMKAVGETTADGSIDGRMTERELLEKYLSGQRRFSGIDIVSDGSNAFVRSCLDEIELIDCFLCASFREVSLRGAIIHSNVKTCDFTGADLTGADFRDSALDGTTFKTAKLDGANFNGAHVQGYALLTCPWLFGPSIT